MVCKHAWLFGDQLHVTLSSEADATGTVKSRLDQWGDPGLRVEIHSSHPLRIVLWD